MNKAKYNLIIAYTLLNIFGQLLLFDAKLAYTRFPFLQKKSYCAK